MSDERINPTFEAWGRMTALPGLQYAVEILQQQLNQLREQLQGTIAEPARKTPWKPRRGRPPKKLTEAVEQPPESKEKTTPESLSKRQKQVSDLAKAGNSVGEIAKTLGISRSSVQVHAGAARKKLDAERVGSKAYGWSGMTAQQRSEEMIRRRKVTKARREAGLGPLTREERRAAERRRRRGSQFLEARQDPKYREKLRAGQQKYWDSLTPEQRDERIKQMTSQQVNGAAKEESRKIVKPTVETVDVEEEILG